MKSSALQNRLKQLILTHINRCNDIVHHITASHNPNLSIHCGSSMAISWSWKIGEDRNVLRLHVKHPKVVTNGACGKDTSRYIIDIAMRVVATAGNVNLVAHKVGRLVANGRRQHRFGGRPRKHVARLENRIADSRRRRR